MVNEVADFRDPRPGDLRVVQPAYCFVAIHGRPKRGVLARTAPVAGLAIGRGPSPTRFPSTRHLSLRSEGSASFMGRASRLGGYIVKRAGDGEAEFWVSGRGLSDQRNGPGNHREDRKHDKASGHSLDEMVGRESREPVLGRAARDL